MYIYIHYTVYTLYPFLWVCDEFMARSFVGIAEALLAGSAPRLPDLQFLPTLSAGSVQSLEIKNGNFCGAQNRVAHNVWCLWLLFFCNEHKFLDSMLCFFWVSVIFWNPIRMDSFSKPTFSLRKASKVNRFRPTFQWGSWNKEKNKEIRDHMIWSTDVLHTKLCTRIYLSYV